MECSYKIIETPLSKSFCFDKHSSLRSLSFNFSISSSDNCDTEVGENNNKLVILRYMPQLRGWLLSAHGNNKTENAVETKQHLRSNHVFTIL